MTYIWETLDFEDFIHEALVRDLGPSHGNDRYGRYTRARGYLLENILEEIKQIQPNMTDHGPRHVRDVLQNMHDLLGESIGRWDKASGDLVSAPGAPNSLELYVLGLSALFHDVGNIFERHEHQKQISTIYDLARSPDSGHQDAEEKQIVLDVCRAHCGEGFDGSRNTLALVPERSKLERRQVRPQLLAPILRLADELAEGEQRTSQFMIQRHQYPEASKEFQQYALSSKVDIDREHGRIRLKYHITVSLTSADTVAVGSQSDGPVIVLDRLPDFLQFIYQRIEKVNQERQYTKHYCHLLDPFKETSAAFSFWHKRAQIPIDLSPISLSDLVVPGDPQRSIVERHDQYEPSHLIGQLEEAVRSMHP